MRATGESDSPLRAGGGTLYIVSTPIGNLEDITLRALKVLSEVDLIAAEDTRTTGNLLRHYSISKPLLSYHNFNEAQRSAALAGKLKHGYSIALVSDAGTPGISDPAYRLVRAAVDAEIPVVAVPGASAILPALVASGCSSERFAFEGFLPAKKGRTKAFERICGEHHTVVVYESPHKILRTLREFHERCPDRNMCVSREMTKKFEEHLRGRAGDILRYLEIHPPRGEFVLTLDSKLESP